jgi:hypothetical protein
MVTHSSTSRPVQCLCMAERTEYTVVTRSWTGSALPGDKWWILIALDWKSRAKFV